MASNNCTLRPCSTPNRLVDILPVDFFVGVGRGGDAAHIILQTEHMLMPHANPYARLPLMEFPSGYTMGMDPRPSTLPSLLEAVLGTLAFST